MNRVFVYALAFATVLAACAPTIRGAAREASRAAVDESVDELTSEESKRDLAKAAQDPKVEVATREFTDQITEGILASLASEDERLRGLTRALVDNAVDELLRELARPENRHKLGVLTATMMRGALDELGASLRTELAPALVEYVRSDMSRGMSEALTSQLQPALGATAQNVAYHAVLGASGGLERAWQGDAFRDVHDLAQVAPGLGWLVLAILSVIALALVALAIIAIARARRMRAEVERLENATLLLATAMRSRTDMPEQAELVALVETALSKRPERSGGRLRRALHLGG